MTYRKLMTRLAPVAAAALLVALPLLAAAQSSETQPSGRYMMPGMHGDVRAPSKKVLDCPQAVRMREQMQDKLRQMQTELDEMVVHMNSMSGKEQQRAMAEALTKLAEQRGAMQDMMMSLQPMMMRHMMQHVLSGDSDWITNCPLMNSRHGADVRGQERTG